MDAGAEVRLKGDGFAPHRHRRVASQLRLFLTTAGLNWGEVETGHRLRTEFWVRLPRERLPWLQGISGKVNGVKIEVVDRGGPAW